MFAQVVQGTGGDSAGLREAWRRTLAVIEAEAAGWLGATSGVAGDGVFVAVLCFETEEMSRITMGRLAEAAAWDPLAPVLTGLSFRECPHVRAFAVGDMDQVDAVEVTQGAVHDIHRVAAAFRRSGRGATAEAGATEHRAGVVAGLLCWDDSGYAYSLLYQRAAPGGDGSSPLAPAGPGTRFAASALRRDAASLLSDAQAHDLASPWSVISLPRTPTVERGAEDGDAPP